MFPIYARLCIEPQPKSKRFNDLNFWTIKKNQFYQNEMLFTTNK